MLSLLARVSAVCILLQCLTCGSLRAATYHVAPGGDDAWAGTSQAPWLTLQHAADTARAGDTVLVATGTYAGFKAVYSGAEGAPITFMPEAGAQVLLNAPSPDNWHGSIVEIEGLDWWEVSGFEVTGSSTRAGIDVRLASHVRVLGCHCHNNYRWGIFTAYTDYFTAQGNECSYSQDEHGIYVSNSSDHVQLLDNTCHHNNASGIQINADPAYEGDGISSNCTVSRNTLYENGAAGGAAINLASVRDSLISDNLIYSNQAGGIAGWDDGAGEEWGTRNNRFHNNTVHQPESARWALSLKNGSTGNEVRNNILLHEGVRGGLELDSSSLAGLDSDYNQLARVDLDEVTHDLAWWQGTYGQDAASQDHSATETFVAVSSDYRLLSTAWALDQGQALEPGRRDLRGRPRVSRRAWDLGCLERGGFALAPALSLIND